MRVVVTGGAGFIGSTLVDRLLADGHQVLVIDDLSRGKLANLAHAQQQPGFAFQQIDIVDPGVVDAIAAFDPDAVAHLAAQIDVRRSVEDPAEDALVNIVGSLRVADGARRGGAKKFVFTSSGGAVHGSILEGEPAANEDAPRRPESPYGVDKMVLIDYLRVYKDLFGLDWTAIAPANVYGPRQDPFGEGGVVAIFAERLVHGTECVIFGDGEQSRDFVHVSDVADAFVRALDAGSGRVYNIGTGVETTVNELYAAMARAEGVEAQATHREARPGEAMRSVLDPSRAKAELGWAPRMTLDEGVATVLDFVRGLA